MKFEASSTYRYLGKHLRASNDIFYRENTNCCYASMNK